jgi:hypothetical protein
VKHLVQGFYRAHALVTSRSAEAARIAAAREHTTPEEYLASLELMRLPDAAETRSLLTGPHPRLLENAKVLSQVMMDQKLLSQPVDPRPLFHEEMLQSVLP